MDSPYSCVVCHEETEDFVYLPCYHVLCRKDDCQAEISRKDVRFYCPLCRFIPKEQWQPEGLNPFSVHKQIRISDGNFICGYCVREDKAVAYCNDCTDYLCELCYENHRIGRRTQGHVITMYKLDEDETQHTVCCNNHESNKATHFCMTCNLEVCEEDGESHPPQSHDVVSLGDFTSDFVERVQLYAEKIKDISIKCQEAEKELEHKIVEIRGVEKDQLITEASAQFTIVLSAIMNRERDLRQSILESMVQKIKELNIKRLKMRSYTAQAKQFSEVVEDIFQKGDVNVVYSHRKNLLERMNYLKKQAFLLDPGRFSLYVEADYHYNMEKTYTNVLLKAIKDLGSFSYLNMPHFKLRQKYRATGPSNGNGNRSRKVKTGDISVLIRENGEKSESSGSQSSFSISQQHESQGSSINPVPGTSFSQMDDALNIEETISASSVTVEEGTPDRETMIADDFDGIECSVVEDESQNEEGNRIMVINQKGSELLADENDKVPEESDLEEDNGSSDQSDYAELDEDLDADQDYEDDDELQIVENMEIESVKCEQENDIDEEGSVNDEKTVEVVGILETEPAIPESSDNISNDLPADAEEGNVEEAQTKVKSDEYEEKQEEEEEEADKGSHTQEVNEDEELTFKAEEQESDEAPGAMDREIQISIIETVIGEDEVSPTALDIQGQDTQEVSEEAETEAEAESALEDASQGLSSSRGSPKKGGSVEPIPKQIKALEGLQSPMLSGKRERKKKILPEEFVESDTIGRKKQKVTTEVKPSMSAFSKQISRRKQSDSEPPILPEKLRGTRHSYK